MVDHHRKIWTCFLLALLTQMASLCLAQEVRTPAAFDSASPFNESIQDSIDGRDIVGTSSFPMTGADSRGVEFDRLVGANRGPHWHEDITGFIDSPVIGNFIRVRMDHIDNIPFGNRAEYLFPAPKFGAKDFNPFVQSFTDTDVSQMQELTTHLEFTVTPRVSLFGDFPVRFVDVNSFNQASRQFEDYQAGLGDISGGIRFSHIQNDDDYLTSQVRVITPTGNSVNFLGTGHTSIEFGLLFQRRYSDRMVVFGELLDWQASGATLLGRPTQLSSPTVGYLQLDPALEGRRFGGNVLRYGMGVAIEGPANFGSNWLTRLQGIFEIQGWTVLDGLKTNEINTIQFGGPSGLEQEVVGTIHNAAGDTIINLNLDARMVTQRGGNLFFGYGRALTGSDWYSNIFRIEYTHQFGGN